MFGRAEIQRTVFVVALLVTAGAANALAREFSAADTWNEEYPTALRFMGRQIAERGNCLRIPMQQSEQTSQTMRALGDAPVELLYGQVLIGLATRPTDRIRKVE